MLKEKINEACIGNMVVGALIGYIALPLATLMAGTALVTNGIADITFDRFKEKVSNNKKDEAE